MRLLPLVISLFLFGIVSCQVSPSRHLLVKAEAMMDDNPEEALAILENIDSTSLFDNRDKAWHALLLSQARDKNYIDVDNDSLISIAVRYYSTTGDKYRNMLSQYYLGIVKYNAGDYPASLLPFVKAYDLATELDDKFWIAMSSRGMSDVYSHTYTNKEEIATAIEAIENFRLANKPQHMIAELLDLGVAYSNDSQCEKAIEIASAVLDSAQKYEDTYLEEGARQLMGIAYIRAKKYPEALSTFKFMAENGMASMDDSIYLGLCFLWNGEIDKAKEISKVTTPSHSEKKLFEWLKYELNIQEGFPEKALDYLKEMDQNTNRVLNEQSRMGLLQTLSTYYDYRDNMKETILRTNRIIFISIIIIFILIIGIIAFFIISMRRKHNETINGYVIIAQNLREILSLKETECSSAQHTIKQLLSSKYAIVDDLCQCYYETSNKTSIRKRLSDTVSELIEQLSDDHDTLTRLEQDINTHYDDILVSFRTDFPNLKPVDYKLMLYLLLGFSLSTIALLLRENKIENVYERKRRLKDRIKRSDSAKRELYLNLIS